MRKLSQKYFKPLLLIVLAVSFGFSASFVEDSQEETSIVTRIFKQVESGIEKNEITMFSEFLSENSFISLRNSSSGYYSINQVHYVLKDFLSLHKPISFRFNNIVTGKEQPYATGLLVFTEKGKRDSAIIYVSLKKDQDTWKISQLSIN